MLGPGLASALPPLKMQQLHQPILGSVARQPLRAGDQFRSPAPERLAQLPSLAADDEIDLDLRHQAGAPRGHPLAHRTTDGMVLEQRAF